jgi:DegV family protein with EDD domain
MNYKIIGDSSLDLTEELKTKMDVSIAPLYITVGNTTFTDNELLDLNFMMEQIALEDQTPKTAAPPPHEFLQYFDENLDAVFIITLSSKLSGSYNAAMLAKDLASETFPHVRVHVFDSLSASSGQTTLALKIHECAEAGMDFDAIVETVEDYKNNDQVYFLIDNLDTFIKNGRMSKLTGRIAQFLHIKPILGDDGNGEIELFGKERTYSRALAKLAEMISSTKFAAEERVLVIAQCFAESRAELLKQMIASKRTFKDIIIVPMRGLSSVYANIGGLVCAF